MAELALQLDGPQPHLRRRRCRPRRRRRGCPAPGPARGRLLRPEVLSDIGAFAALTRLPGGLREPVLVSATDGAGTNTLWPRALAASTPSASTWWPCAPMMSCAWARAASLPRSHHRRSSRPGAMSRRWSPGWRMACRQAGCALLGGEVAEHPGLMSPGEWDIGGFVVGVVERDAIATAPDRATWRRSLALPSRRIDAVIGY